MSAPIRSDARRSIDAILLSARLVLGQDATSGIDEVARAAGLHRATVYRHFPSREALVARLYEAYLDDAEAAILEADPATPDLRAEIEELVRRVYEVNLFWRPYAWAPAYASETDPRRARFSPLMVPLFQRAQEQGQLRADLSVRLLLTTWGSSVPFYASRINQGEFTLDEVVDVTLTLLT